MRVCDILLEHKIMDGSQRCNNDECFVSSKSMLLMKLGSFKAEIYRTNPKTSRYPHYVISLFGNTRKLLLLLLLKLFTNSSVLIGLQIAIIYKHQIRSRCNGVYSCQRRKKQKIKRIY